MSHDNPLDKPKLKYPTIYMILVTGVLVFGLASIGSLFLAGDFSMSVYWLVWSYLLWWLSERSFLYE